MLLSKLFKQHIFHLLAFLALIILFISCKGNFEFNGDLRQKLEEDCSSVIYFKKSETSPVAFKKLYRIGGDYTSSDLPDMYSEDVWNMNPGFDLGGWKIESESIPNALNLELDASGYVSSFYLSTKSITLYGDGYVPSSRTPYKVCLYKEKLNPLPPYLYTPKDFEYYTTIDAQGTTNTTTNVAVLLNPIPGFFDPVSGSDFMDDNINAAGDTVIQVQYRRKDDIIITIQDTSLSPAYLQSSGPGVFEAPLESITLPSKSGYTISGWKQIMPGTLEETTIESLPTKYPAYNYEYNPIWQPIQVSYTINHKRQNALDLTLYDLYESETKYGYTGTNTEAAVMSYEGFTAQTFTQDIISGDGSTEINIYYDRNSYNLTFDPNDGSGTTGSLQAFTYGVTAALNANGFTRSGYSFKGWATSKARADAGIVDYTDGADYTIAASDTTLYAVWQPNAISITIDLPDPGGVGIECIQDPANPGEITLNARHINADGSYGDIVSASDGYTFNWFYTEEGLTATRFTGSSWTLSLSSGLYNISLIATKNGVPSGGTIQIKIE